MSNNITRNEIAESIFKEIGLSRSECNEFVDTIVEYLITGIINDEVVKIASFGTFKLRQKKQREGRNPKTKESKIISSRNVDLFKASKEFKLSINS